MLNVMLYYCIPVEYDACLEKTFAACISLKVSGRKRVLFCGFGAKVDTFPHSNYIFILKNTKAHVFFYLIAV